MGFINVRNNSNDNKKIKIIIYETIAILISASYTNCFATGQPIIEPIIYIHVPIASRLKAIRIC